MRRKLTIVALAAMLLAAGGPALAQSPNIQLQVQPRILIQPRIQQKLKIQPKLNKPPVRPTIPLSLVTRNIMATMPGAKVLKIGPLPGGDIIATIRIKNQVRRVRFDGQTGEMQN